LAQRWKEIKANMFWALDGFGLHDWANLQWSPRPHTDSVWDVLYMVGK
jgi:hypothetical protein